MPHSLKSNQKSQPNIGVGFKKIPINTTNYETGIFPLILLAEVLFQDFHKIAGGHEWSNYSIGIWDNRVNKWAVERKPSILVAKYFIKKFEKDRRFLKTVKNNIFKFSNELVNFSKKFKKENLKNLSDSKLWQYYHEYINKYKKMYLWGWLPNALEGEGSYFTLNLEKLLLEELKRLGKQNQIGEYFTILTTLSEVRSERMKEKEDLLKILMKTKKSGKITKLFKRDLDYILIKLPSAGKEIDNLLEKHTKQYAWLTFNYEGPALDKKHFTENLKKLINKDPIKELNRIKQDRKLIIKKQTKYTKELGIYKDNRLSFLFELARWMFFLKDWRKNMLYQSYFYIDFLIKEIARRLNLTPTQVRHILPLEMKNALIKKKYNLSELKERVKFSAALFKDGNYKIYTGKKAREIVWKYVKLTPTFKLQNEFSGQVAYPGKVKGKIKIILDSKDNIKMEKGEILVSEKTDPSLVPAIQKAKAIITDMGGITCHAAIIARELKIPCIIGTKIATQVLKDGDLVEVDADKGEVRVIQKNIV